MKKKIDVLILSVMISIVLTVQTKSESYINSPPKSPFVLSRRTVCVIKKDNIMSKKIPLTQGQFTIVDDDMYEYLNQFKWYAQWSSHTKSFYVIRREKWEDSKWHTFSMAREILGLRHGDKRQADHINHNTLDNCLSNLRIVTNQQNGWNRRNPKGYYWHKARQKYQAQIALNGVHISLGYFHTTKEAHNAYLSAKEIYHNYLKENENGLENTNRQ